MVLREGVAMLSAAVGSVCTASRRRPWVRLNVVRAGGPGVLADDSAASSSSDSDCTNTANRFTEIDMFQKDNALLPRTLFLCAANQRQVAKHQTTRKFTG